MIRTSKQTLHTRVLEYARSVYRLSYLKVIIYKPKRLVVLCEQHSPNREAEESVNTKYSIDSTSITSKTKSCSNNIQNPVLPRDMGRWRNATFKHIGLLANCRTLQQIEVTTYPGSMGMRFIPPACSRQLTSKGNIPTSLERFSVRGEEHCTATCTR